MSVNYVDPSTGALTSIAGTPAKVVNSISNPNLLDNPWFTINQRGNGTMTGVDGYITDRWTYVNAPSGGGTTITSDDGIRFYGQTVSRYLLQRIPLNEANKLVGKTLTASILLSDGTIYSGTKVYLGNRVNYINNDKIMLYTLPQTNLVELLGVEIKPNVDITVRAVKLEIGSTSTLDRDTAPNYATELLKCQRYFFRLKNRNVPYRGIVGCALASSTNSIQLPITLPTEMRSATPSITVNNISGLKLNDGTNEVTATSISPNSTFSNIRTLNILSAGNLTAGKIYNAIFEADIDVSIDFSADL